MGLLNCPCLIAAHMDNSVSTHLRGKEERTWLSAIQSERHGHSGSRDRTLPAANQESSRTSESAVDSVRGLVVHEDTQVTQKMVPLASDTQLRSHNTAETNGDTALETDDDGSIAADEEIVLLWNTTYNRK